MYRCIFFLIEFDFVEPSVGWQVRGLGGGGGGYSKEGVEILKLHYIRTLIYSGQNAR